MRYPKKAIKFCRVDTRTYVPVRSPIQISILMVLAASLLESGLSAPQHQQFHDPSMAKIIQEQRFNLGNDQFGHAAQQEDGTMTREESTANNNRVGQYEYIGDDGKLYTVKYEAGVNGFR